jgi:hypothetical protein
MELGLLPVFNLQRDLKKMGLGLGHSHPVCKQRRCRRHNQKAQFIFCLQ